MLTIVRRFVIPTTLAVGALAFTACGGSVAEQPGVAQAAATKAPVAQNAHGPVKLMGDALGEVALRTDQRAAIEQLAADAESRHAETRQARKDLMEAIALQIETGSIDRTALQPKIDASVAAFEKVRPLDRAALEKLHAILDADQRSLFVDALKDKIHEKWSEHGGKEHMAEWAADLKLTDAQQDQIRTALRSEWQAHRAAGGGKPPWAEGKERAGKIFDAFKTDRFVLDEVAPPVDARQMATRVSDRVLHVAEVVLPILTPEQRTLAAQKLRAHAEAVETPEF